MPRLLTALLFLVGTHSISLAASTCSVTLTDGTTQTGEIQAWSERVLRLTVSGETRDVAVNKIAKIELSHGEKTRSLPPLADTNRYTVHLQDGSNYPAQAVTIAEKTITTTADQASPRTIPLAQVRWIQYNTWTEKTNQQWQEIVKSGLNGDVLIVRKPGDAIDYLEGAVQGMDADQVQFQFDGESLDVSMEKLAGIWFLQKRAAPPVAAAYRVAMQDGSTWNCKSLEFANDRFSMTTLGGLQQQVPMGEITSVQCAAGAVIYLSDLPYEQLRVTPFAMGSALGDDLLKMIYGPTVNQAIDGSPLQLMLDPETGTTQIYAKGLGLHSRTELTYRLRGQYRRLMATAGISPSTKGQGNLRLVIRADQNVLLDVAMTAIESPQEIDLDVSDARNLTILVDYEKDGDIADLLNLCDLRIVK